MPSLTVVGAEEAAAEVEAVEVAEAVEVVEVVGVAAEVLGVEVAVQEEVPQVAALVKALAVEAQPAPAFSRPALRVRYSGS